MDSLAGRLLIASPTLLDPNFEKTVSLLVQHGEAGALGLVLNRPTQVPLRDAWESVSEQAYEGDELLHAGGPCEGPLMALHREPSHAQLAVAEGLFFAAEREHVAGLIGDRADPAAYFVGYAGWGPGQLEAELGTGSWLLADAEPELVFQGEQIPWGRLAADADPNSLRRRIDPRLLPDDPSLN